MMAAWNPAAWAFLTLTSKGHFPLSIKANRGCSASASNPKLFRSEEQASRGSAKWRAPQIPDLFTGIAAKRELKHHKLRLQAPNPIQESKNRNPRNIERERESIRTETSRSIEEGEGEVICFEMDECNRWGWEDDDDAEGEVEEEN